MIHYTLLPKEEMHALRWEYRSRLFIVVCFFISCALLVGIISLLPSFFYSRFQESQALDRTNALQASRKASGADQIDSELAQSEIIAEKLTLDKPKISYLDIIQKLVSYRTSQVTLSSFEISPGAGTSTPYQIILQGHAETRDALLAYEKGLQGDTAFSSVDLPLSDLAESKNVNFAMQINLAPISLTKTP